MTTTKTPMFILHTEQDGEHPDFSIHSSLEGAETAILELVAMEWGLMLKTDGSKRPTELNSGVDFLVQECRCVSVAIIVASLDEGPGEMVYPDPSVWREDVQLAEPAA